MAFLKLGWNWSRPNFFSGPDQKPINDSFMSLQKFLTFPYVGLRFDGTMDLDGTLAPIPFTAVSSAASPFVAGDPYNLWRSATSDIQVPREFDTWMLIGHAGFLTDSAGVATDILTVGWRVNAVNDVWFQHLTGTDASRTICSIMKPVRKGDTIQVTAASTAGLENLTDCEAWAYFMPLG